MIEYIYMSLVMVLWFSLEADYVYHIYDWVYLHEMIMVL